MDHQQGHLVEVVVAPAIPPGMAIDLTVLQEELEQIAGVTHVAKLERDEMRLHVATDGHTCQRLRLAVYTAYSRAAERTLERAPLPPGSPGRAV